jgi:hypothetical protein
VIPSRPSGLSVSVQEQVLIDLAQWLARAQQYSPSHASAVALGDKTHRLLTRALQKAAPLEYGILKTTS